LPSAINATAHHMFATLGVCAVDKSDGATPKRDDVIAPFVPQTLNSCLAGGAKLNDPANGGWSCFPPIDAKFVDRYDLICYGVGRPKIFYSAAANILWYVIIVDDDKTTLCYF
jgi:hypothetical protein